MDSRRDVTSLPVDAVPSAAQAQGATAALASAAFGPAWLERKWRRGASARGMVVGLACLAPSLVVFGMFVFYPLARSFWLSLFANDLLGQPVAFVGLEQYLRIVTDARFGKVMAVTAWFVVLTVVPSILIGLGLALLVRPRIAGVGIFRTLLATPFAFSAAATAVVFDVFYRPGIGLFNGLLSYLDIPPVDWLTSPAAALPSLALAVVWRHAGYTMLVCLAGLESIPDALYEAARIDGASRRAQFRWITLPLLTPTLFFLIVITTIHALQTFGEIKILTHGGPAGSTTTLVYSLYETAFGLGSSDYGLASAQGVVLMLIVLVITFLQFRVLGRRVVYA
jgi:sn-glycerol 3-phosphate transport system permease protein